VTVELGDQERLGISGQQRVHASRIVGGTRDGRRVSPEQQDGGHVLEPSRADDGIG
jgi:hypothetical protein